MFGGLFLFSCPGSHIPMFGHDNNNINNKKTYYISTLCFSSVFQSGNVLFVCMFSYCSAVTALFPSGRETWCAVCRQSLQNPNLCCQGSFAGLQCFVCLFFFMFFYCSSLSLGTRDLPSAVSLLKTPTLGGSHPCLVTVCQQIKTQEMKQKTKRQPPFRFRTTI